MTAKATLERNAKIRSLTEQVSQFDMSNPVHVAHYNDLKGVFGELAAIMLISQDVTQAARQGMWPSDHDGVAGLEITDPGAIASHPGWEGRNRAVRHGEVARYFIIDPEADTKVGGRVIAMFTREQTVPAYTQPKAE
jgi:hypothetical protein